MKKETSFEDSPRYKTFLGLVKKFKDNWIEAGESEITWARNVTQEEMQLVQSYLKENADTEIELCEASESAIASVIFYSRAAAYRLWHYSYYSAACAAPSE